MPLSLHNDPWPPPDSHAPGQPGRDSDLSRRIRSGDESAFELLFRDHYHGLSVFAARIVGADAAAEEIVQDTLLRVWERRADLAIKETIAAYLYGAVRNQALLHLRRGRVEQRWRDSVIQGGSGVRSSAPPQADEGVQAAELVEAIDRAIAALPVRCREAYLLRRQHHLTYVEIAEVMGIAPKTVEIHIGAALKALKRSLADWLAP